MKKRLLIIGVCSLAFLTVGLTIASCNGGTTIVDDGDGDDDGGDDDNGGGDTETSNIKSLTAKAESFEVKIGESHLGTDFYDIEPVKGTLTSKDRSATLTSSDESVIEVSNKVLKAVGIGTAAINVVSKVDETKTCTFTLSVKDVYFDRDRSMGIQTSDDFTNELPSDGGTVRTSSEGTVTMFIKNDDVTKQYIETKAVLNSTADSENYPKLGIVFSTFDNPTIENTTNNQVYLFLDAYRGSGNTNSDFINYGVCEVSNLDGWARNAGITNATARHKDDAYKMDQSITFGGGFKIGVARDGLNFHVWVNDNYAFSCTVLESLFGTYDTDGTTVIPSVGGGGFFEFNSDVTFSEYSMTTDETAIDQKIAGIETPKFIGTEGFDRAAD